MMVPRPYSFGISILASGRVEDRQTVLRKFGIDGEAYHLFSIQPAASFLYPFSKLPLEVNLLVSSYYRLKPHGYETLPYFGFSESNWVKLKTDNPSGAYNARGRATNARRGNAPDNCEFSAKAAEDLANFHQHRFHGGRGSVIVIGCGLWFGHVFLPFQCLPPEVLRRLPATLTRRCEIKISPNRACADESRYRLDSIAK